MSRYSLDDIRVRLRAGRGIAVICEGETSSDDESLYNTWFGSRAPEITFFSQDGFPQVARAVEELRAEHPDLARRVYGLRDRDFADDRTLADQGDLAYCGPIFRLPRYTIENYLLDPEGWARVVKALHVREPSLPQDWDSADAIADHILGFCHAAIPVAAHNWVVHGLTASHRDADGFRERRYLMSIVALQSVPVEDELRKWATRFGVAEEAVGAFEERRDFLTALSSADDLSRYVSGKLVYHQLHEAIPFAHGRKKDDRASLLDRYINAWPSRPHEVEDIAEQMLRLSRR